MGRRDCDYLPPYCGRVRSAGWNSDSALELITSMSCRFYSTIRPFHFTGWVCPLTSLENYFRSRASGSGYTGSFIQHYIFSLLNIGQGTRAMETWIGVFLLCLNCSVWGVLSEEAAHFGTGTARIERHDAGQEHIATSVLL